jgi:ABC-type sugar transport system ATPase subunit
MKIMSDPVGMDASQQQQAGQAHEAASSATSSSTCKNISLAFGGVKALTDISFDVREHEIRAIIGPNGAGKSSMLNCINGVYQPQQGTITFRGQTFHHMKSRQVAEMGIARTFQNLALFKGMSVLDNIMTGRNLQDQKQPAAAGAAHRPGRARGDPAPRGGGADHRLPGDPGLPQDARGPAALRPAEARGPGPRAGDGAAGAAARRAHGRHERGGEAGHVPLHAGRQRRVRHHGGPDRARHGRGDGHLRPRGGAGLRQEDRRRHARRSARQPGRDQGLPGHAAH